MVSEQGRQGSRNKAARSTRNVSPVCKGSSALGHSICLSSLTAGFRHSYLLPPCHKENECDSESLSRGSDGLSFVLLWRTASRPQMDMPCVHTALGLAGDSGPWREASLTRATKVVPEPANRAHSAPRDSWVQGPARGQVRAIGHFRLFR